jgi:hypothetical protein
MTLLAAGQGGWIFVGVIALILGGVVYGYFTVSGSGIAHHPHDGSAGAPGAKGPSESSGRDQGEGSASTPTERARRRDYSWATTNRPECWTRCSHR